MKGYRKKFIIEIFVKVNRYFQAIFKRDNKMVHFIILNKFKLNSYINSVIIVFVLKKTYEHFPDREKLLSYNQ